MKVKDQLIRERIQFGEPIGSHQLIQELLAKSLANITSSIALVTRVSDMLDEGAQRDEHSALAKEFATSRMRSGSADGLKQAMFSAIEPANRRSSCSTHPICAR